jgi:circadian clock protein KaiC
VTTFFTQELPYFGGQPGQPSVSDSVLFENILLLRYADSGGIHQRQVGVLKLRENGYDAASHLLRISDSGLTIEGLGAGVLAQPPQV